MKAWAGGQVVLYRPKMYTHFDLNLHCYKNLRSFFRNKPFEGQLTLVTRSKVGIFVGV